MTPAEKQAKGHELIAKGHQLLAEAALEAMKPQPRGDVYTSAKAGPFPPGKSRDWTRRNLPKIPGAYKVGQAWCIRAEDFLSHARALDVARVKAETAAPSLDVKEIARAALAGAGYRKAG